MHTYIYICDCPALAFRSHGWPKTLQHLATNVAECMRPGTSPICYEAWR